MITSLTFDICGDCSAHDPVRCMCRKNGSYRVANDTACLEYDARIKIAKPNKNTGKVDPFFGIPIR